MMNYSEILYKGLISFGQERLKEFFKNIKLYDSQFQFNDLNTQCNNEMYSGLKLSESYPPRQNFYEKIPNLKAECGKCYKYFMNPRNKFIKGLDIQLGKLLEEVFMEYLRTLRINITRGDTKNKRYPDILVLDRTREILGYIELKYHAAPFLLTYQKRPGRECYEGSLTLDKEKVIKQLKIIYSELDRPVFYVHWVDFPCIKGIFCQTSEQLHELLLSGIGEYTRKEREGDFNILKDGTVKKVGYSEKIYPSITEMWNFEEMIKIINDNK